MNKKKKKSRVKAKKQEVEDCFTCLICNNLFDHATTISECLHTFCRKCIHDKITQENLNACPVCNADLGVAPLDKLRTDNTFEDLKLKVFKPKPETVKAATETVAASSQSSKKKEKSLSSLLATSCTLSSSAESNPDAPLEPEKLGEKVEAVPEIPSSSRPISKSLEPEKLGKKVEAVPEIPSSSRPISKYRRRQRKNPKPKRNDFGLELEQPPHKEGENDFQILLNIEQDNGLAGAGTSQGCIQKENKSEKDIEMEVTPLKRDDTPVIVEPAISLNGKEKHVYVSSSGGDTEEVSAEKSEECAEENQNTVLISSDSDTEEVSGEEPKNNAKENQESVPSSSGEKQKGKAYSPPVLRSRRQRNRYSAGTSQNAISKEAEKTNEGSNKPVWFSLVARRNQNTDRPLPQITPLYLRVANGNLPVSYVKKYLVKKLSLESEDEVEIWLRQEPVCSTQLLHNLVDWWVQTTPIAERRSAKVGGSGADFVMKLFYSRSHLYP